MYMQYNSRQYQLLEFDYYGRHSGPHNRPPKRLGRLSEPTFKPTVLIRVSDMKRVRGCDVKEGYCTLSYSWNQSGDIRRTGDDYERVDNQNHMITTYLSKKKAWKPRGRRKLKQTRCVKFEDFVQRICQDFGVRYVWYDQMCINQSNSEEKKRELRLMHLIYQHAHCTIALVPELEVFTLPHWDWNMIKYDMIEFGEWAKRLWTLEEAFLTKEILFVGRNVHVWSSSPVYDPFDGFISSLCDKSAQWSASTALWHARSRGCTKIHDRIFALANIFPELIDQISFSYDQPLLPLMLKFYGLLAAQDLSVLCFGQPGVSSVIPREEDRMLPSWTGVSGIHVRPLRDSRRMETSFSDYTIIEEFMHVNCSYIPVIVKRIESRIRVRRSSLDETSLVKADMKPTAKVRLSGTSIVVVPRTDISIVEKSYHYRYGISEPYTLPVRQNQQHEWINTASLVDVANAGESSTTSSSESMATMLIGTLGFLSLTEECDSCTILSGIPFTGRHPSFQLYPVVTRNGDFYKCIGVCELPPISCFEPAISQVPKLFVIK